MRRYHDSGENANSKRETLLMKLTLKAWGNIIENNPVMQLSIKLSEI